MSTARRENDHIVFSDERNVDFSLAEYTRLVNGLAQDMTDFMLRVEQWLDRHCAKATLRDEIVTIFRRTLSLPPHG